MKTYKDYKWIIGLIVAVAITGLLFYQAINSNDFFEGVSMIDYEESLEKFDRQFTDHFPKELGSNHTLLTSEDISHSHLRIWLKTEIEGDDVDSLIVHLQARSLAQYSAADTCLLVVDSHLTENNWLKFDKTVGENREINLVNKDCYKDKLPVPKFWNSQFFNTNETRVGLSKEYELFVLDSRAGQFKVLDSLPNGRYTYNGWEHGYTKGIALNKNEERIIFWFDMW